MSVEVLSSCPGCGVCVRPKVCPTNAISISGGKAFIGSGCIDCGLCIPVCPIGLIKPAATVESQAESTNQEWAAAEEQADATDSGEEDSNGERETSPGP